jgi:diguanylate cyclase (GGDEF)-like protein/PAS domain S-box-containing protein
MGEHDRAAGARSPLLGCVEVAAVALLLVVLNRLELTGQASSQYLLLVAGLGLSWPFLRRIRSLRDRLEPSSPLGRQLEMMRLSLVCTLVVYGIGWGPVLVPGYAVLVPVAISKWGAWAWKRAVAWIVAGVLAGQAAIALGWAYSYIDTPEAYGVGAVGLLVTVVMGAELGLVAVRRERAERRLDALVENGSDMISVISAGSVITYQSRSVARVLGYRPEDLVGHAFTDLVHPDDLDGGRATVNAGVERLELRLRRADESWCWCAISVADLRADPFVEGYVLNIGDVTDRHLLEDELRHLAFHDPLTGLANRALFFDRLERALTRRARTGEQLAVLVLDLDDFKNVNDTSGHEAGDELLVEAAHRLAEVVRDADTAARIGGDEFAVIIEEWGTGEAPAEIAERFRAALAGPSTHSHRSHTVSVGIAIAEPWTTDARVLIAAADAAMYAAKSQGKNRIAVYDARARSGPEHADSSPRAGEQVTPPTVS